MKTAKTKRPTKAVIIRVNTGSIDPITASILSSNSAVKYSAKELNYDVENITRENWDELFDIKDSIVYNCTPLNIADWIDTSNLFIDCLVNTPTGILLANLQASKQFELYTGLEFPL